MSQARILLVSTDCDARELYATWFARTADLKTICSSSLGEARPVLDRRAADVILVDLTRPSQWTDWLPDCLAHEAIPVVVLTGWVAEDGRFRKRAFGLGCAAFVAKPCHPRVLVTVLRRVLDGERHIAIA